MARCAKGLGSDDTGTCRPTEQIPILRWLESIGCSRPTVELFAARGISFREVELNSEQELEDRGVQVRKDRVLIMDHLPAKMIKIRRAYDRFCDQIMAEFVDEIPKLVTSDKGATPGAGAEGNAGGAGEEEELVDAPDEQGEPVPPPKCPFDSDDQFTAYFNSDPAVIGFKAATCMTYTTKFQADCFKSAYDCKLAKDLFIKQITKLYHPDRFAKVHPGCNKEMVMLAYSTLGERFSDSRTRCSRKKAEL